MKGVLFMRLRYSRESLIAGVLVLALIAFVIFTGNAICKAGKAVVEKQAAEIQTYVSLLEAAN
jgi:hypothetical protein